MALDVLLPQLGLTMTEGTIQEWKKKVGDPVKKGEVIFNVENDKATIDVEAQTDGVLAQIVVGEKVTVPTGTLVAVIAAPGEAVEKKAAAPAAAAPAASAPAVAEAPVAAPVSASAPAVAASKARNERADGFVLASPFARKLAESQSIDLAELRGTGPEGAVIARDLPSQEMAYEYRPAASAAASAAPTTPVKATPIPVLDEYKDIELTRIQKVAAERMVESWTSIPQFTLYDEADASALLDLAARYKQAGEPVSMTVILAKLLARAAEAHPLVNASWLGGGRVRTFRQVNVNIAMDTSDGLVVPVLRDCGDRGFKALGKDMKALAEKAKARSLGMADYEGGTITLSNLGMFGIKRFRAIVNPPQTAILAVGAISERLYPCDDDCCEYGDEACYETRKVLEYSITADHRAVDGAYAARFMATLKSFIEDPLRILD